MRNGVSKEFLSKVENANIQLCIGLDNLGFMIEATDDSIFNTEALGSALWCTYNQIKSVYDTLKGAVSEEYDQLRGERHE